jgi:hypothetical protein
MSTERVKVCYGEMWRTDYVLRELRVSNMPEDYVQNMLLDLVLDTFEAMAWAFDETVRWSMERGCVTRESPKGVVFVDPFPYGVFLYTIRHKAIDAVAAPLLNWKMEDGMSSPLTNDVEKIMLCLPEDKFYYSEDV